MLRSWANFYARGGLGLGAGGAEVGVGVVGKGELVLLRELLGDAAEFFVTVVGSQEAAVNGQRGSVVAWHLHLQVCVVRYCHKLGERWASQDGVIL